MLFETSAIARADTGKIQLVIPFFYNLLICVLLLCFGFFSHLLLGEGSRAFMIRNTQHCVSLPFVLFCSVPVDFYYESYVMVFFFIFLHTTKGNGLYFKSKSMSKSRNFNVSDLS